MFLFKKILTPFLLPPGIFSALALCLAILKFRKDRKQALVWAGFALLIWGASIKPIEDFALTRLEYSYLPPSELKADAVVLLGGGVGRGPLSLSAYRNFPAYRLKGLWRPPGSTVGISCR